AQVLVERAGEVGQAHVVVGFEGEIVSGGSSGHGVRAKWVGTPWYLLEPASMTRNRERCRKRWTTRIRPPTRCVIRLQIINCLINNGDMTSSRKPRVTRRGAGRPSDDGVDHRERLLDAAIARFARDGIGATSLRAIAADAEVTPA